MSRSCTLQRCHNGISNHRRLKFLLYRLFRSRSKKTSKLRVTGVFDGNPPVTGGFSSQRPVTRKMFLFHDVIVYTLKIYFISQRERWQYQGSSTFSALVTWTHTAKAVKKLNLERGRGDHQIQLSAILSLVGNISLGWSRKDITCTWLTCRLYVNILMCVV